MELILWRHAEAEDGMNDQKRELTRRGRKQAERMANWLKPLLVGEWRILVSPSKRTLQTVKALDLPFDVRDGLAPSGTAQELLREAGWPEGNDLVLVVGHQPTLGQVAAKLLGNSAGEVSIRKGAVWWFATRERGGGREVLVKAVINPDLLDEI